MSNNKMKGLLKGLRYISQIFDNEKEPEIQIGYPTDVKHVAHIGWDGPSANSPSWMNDFKANSKGEPEDDAASWAFEDSAKRTTKSSILNEEPSEKPRSRRNSSSGAIEMGLSKEKPEKPKQRRTSKSSAKDSDGKSSRQKDSTGCSSSNPAKLPKKSRRKKSKDITQSKSKSQTAADADCGSDCGSVSRSAHNDNNSDFGSNVSANFSGLEDEMENFRGVS